MRSWLPMIGLTALLLVPEPARPAARWGNLLCYDFVVEGRIARYANQRDALCGDGSPECVATEVLIRSDKVLTGRSAPDSFWATAIIQDAVTPRARLFLFVTRDDDGRYYVIDTSFARNEDFDVAGRPKLSEISRAVVCPAVG